MQRDPASDRIGALYIPEVAQRESARGFCCLHEPNELDENLTGRFIYFERLAGEPFSWAGKQLELMYEGSALAVDMTGKELQEALGNAVAEQVGNLSLQLDENDIDKVEAAVDGIIDAARDTEEED